MHTEKNTIILNTDEDLPSINGNDRYVINIENGSGNITGANSFSLLTAVYRLLEELGFRYPSPLSTVIPAPCSGSFSTVFIRIKSEAEYRHRGIVIEGGNRLENVLDIISWMPKLGYNSFFLQFKVPYIFFASWYTHMQNDTLTPEPFDIERAVRMGHAAEEAAKERGIILHEVGHAWTSAAVGIEGLGWEKIEDAAVDSIRDRLALIDGKRALFHGVPINTNLCYSDKKNVDAIVNEITGYARTHKNVDIIHVWLADENNNVCECEECRKTTPADQYIRILNKADEALEGENLKARLCMLIYNDLLAPPESERIKNKDRFVLMFAPIARTFEKSYCEMGPIPSYKPYERNRNTLPVSIEENVAYLKGWQKTFDGDSFDFDYHLGRAHYGDPGYMKISKIIHQDIRELKKLGLNGLMSCQELRCFFPTALPNYVMGKTLWNSNTDFEKIASEYFKAEYGACADQVKSVMEEISSFFSMDYWNAKMDAKQSKLASSFRASEKCTAKLDALIEKHKQHPDIAHIDSWRRLELLSEYIKRFSAMLIQKADGESSKAEYDMFADFVKANEIELQGSLDVYRLLRLCSEYLHLNM